MSSGFSENKGLWGFLSLAGSQKKCLPTQTIEPPISPFLQLEIKETYMMQKCWEASVKYPKLIDVTQIVGLPNILGFYSQQCDFLVV